MRIVKSSKKWSRGSDVSDLAKRSSRIHADEFVAVLERYHQRFHCSAVPSLSQSSRRPASNIVISVPESGCRILKHSVVRGSRTQAPFTSLTSPLEYSHL